MNAAPTMKGFLSSVGNISKQVANNVQAVASNVQQQLATPGTAHHNAPQQQHVASPSASSPDAVREHSFKCICMYAVPYFCMRLRSGGTATARPHAETPYLHHALVLANRRRWQHALHRCRSHSCGKSWCPSPRVLDPCRLSCGCVLGACLLVG